MPAAVKSPFVKTLLEDPSEVNRSRAHFELGRLAVADNDPNRAATHFREAIDLDPTDEQPRRALEALGSGSTPRPGVGRSLLGRLFGVARR